ncbi:MAG: DUF1501 domain-containing protein [Propionibacteriales bacterium]|nr:DUF1501 domain-containing protein [Propionibacteriales bacterium]
MTVDQACSCPDYRSTRRNFLRNVSLASGGTVAATMFGDTFRQTAYGATNANVVVVLSLRGGADFLSMVVPHGDSAYYRARPHIAVPRSSLICADNDFGLHPAFAPLKSMWTSNQMGVVLATGLPVPNRSHFDAIEEIEDAAPGSELRSGWINRLIGLQPGLSPLEGVSVGSGLLPTSMVGPQATLAATSTDAIDLSGGSTPKAQRARRRALSQVWAKSQSPLGLGARSTLSTTAALRSTLSHGYTPANGAKYPTSSLGDALSDTARLVKASVGVEVVTLDFGGWDMHSDLGTLESGSLSMNGMVTGLAKALAAFFQDLGSTGSRVTLVTVTEFGRRVAENGARGLDHGWANSTLVLGGGVRGGRYHGRWPGLSDAQLGDGDLAVTTDYRSVLSEILDRRFGVSTSTVFPDFRPEPVGVMA